MTIIKTPKQIQWIVILFMLLSINGFTQTEIKTELAAPIYTIYYPTNHWELTVDNTTFLYSYVVQIIQTPNPPNLIIYLEGYTDDVGDADDNMQLSQKRVQAVAEYLISKGFRQDQIKMSYFGESKPETRNIAVSKKLKDIRYSNRRVVITIEKII